MNRAVLIGSFMVLSHFSLVGQGLSVALESARRAYFDGAFSKAIEELNTIHDDNLIEAEWIDKYRLLVRSSLVLEEEEKAEEYLNILLEKHPVLINTKDALPRFNDFKDLYEVQVNDFLSFDLGVNVPIPIILKDQSFSSKFTRPNTYQSLVGLNIGLNKGWMFKKSFSIAAGLQFNQYRLEFDEAQMDIQRIFVSEQYNELAVPVAIGIHRSLKSTEFSFSVGIRPTLLLSSEADLRFTADEVRNGGQITPFTFVGKYPVNNYRRSLMLDYQVSLGIKRFFNRRFVALTATYVYGPKNRTVEEERFEDEDLYRTYSYVPDDLARDMVQVTMGIGFANFKVVRK